MAGILSGPIDAPSENRQATAYPKVPAVPGMQVTHRASGFVGTLLRIEGGGVELRGAGGLERVFRQLPGAFAVDGQAVSLVRPAAPSKSAGPVTTTSGSLAVPPSRARVARGGRLWVEGAHDAELVERVWGDDLREEGIVVERLDGIDRLAEAVGRFRPGPARRLGVLVDHLVPGSKESRLADAVAGPDVLVTGTPFVDVWQAVRPAVVGLEAWPVIPMGTDWKTGICAVLGLGGPSATWRHLLARVTTYADLEPALVGAVERLIDFVTEPT
jgi:hypothetical protein